MPAVRLCVRTFRLSFAFFHLTFASQNSFHLSLMPRRAPHFLFGKKMGEKNREGLRPFEPHSCALRSIFSSSALLAGLAALWAANRRLTGKRLKSQGAKLSFSSVSVRGGTGGPTFCVFLEVWRGFLPGRFSPSQREQELSFLPARENRSRARARTRKEPRACEARGRKRQGARLAHRRCAGVGGFEKREGMW